MNTIFPLLTSLAAALVFAACSDSPTNDLDGGNTTQDAGPRNVSPIPGGGTAGGPIAGQLTVFVLDNETDAPIPGADVIAKAGSVTLMGKTDAAGRVDLSGEQLMGALDVHAFATGFAAESAFGLNASVFTIALDAAIEPVAAKFGIASGNVLGWDVLAVAGQGQARLAVVGAAGNDLIEPMTAVRPGSVSPASPNGLAYNTLLNGSPPFPMWTDYQLNADVRAKVLFVLGGIFTAQGTSVAISHFGLRKNVSLSDGQTTAAQDITLSMPLDQNIDVRFTGALPNGLTTAQAGASVQQREDEITIFLGGKALVQGAASVKMPALSGDLADWHYLVIVRFSNGTPETQSSVLFSRVDGLSHTFTTALGAPGLPSAAERTVSWVPAGGADVHLLALDTPSGRPLWRVAVIGEPRSAVSLPVPPEGRADPLSGDVQGEVQALDVGGADLNASTFDSLRDKVEAISNSMATLHF